MENLNKFPLCKLSKSLCLLLAAMCISFNALAQTEVTVDGLWYSISDETATVVAVADNTITNLIIPETITVDSKSYPVTAIAEIAFTNCYDLMSVTIPNSVIEISGNPFGNCHALESFNGKFASDDHRCLIVEGRLISFAPANLTEYSIPNSVTAIDSRTFQWCSLLTSIDIPSSVIEFGVNPFDGCLSLESFSGKYASEDHRCLIVEERLISFAPANLTEYSIPNYVTAIGSRAFDYCDGLTSVDIPNLVIEIGDYAFSNCYGLKSVTIPNSVITIGEYAFSSCGLTSVDIPNSVITVGEGAFLGCDFTSVTIPNSVTSIGSYAFQICTNLTSVTVDNPDPANIELGREVFSGVNPNHCTLYVPKESVELYKVAEQWNEFGSIEAIGIKTVDGIKYILEAETATVSGLADETITNLNIPKSITVDSKSYPVTAIGDEAFKYCRYLTALTIGNSVTSIGDYAFAWCSNLTSVVIGNSVTNIGEYAFYACSCLASADIPNSVTTIGEGAFTWCDGLASVTIGNSVTSIGEYAFSKCSGLTSVTVDNPDPANIGLGLDVFYDVPINECTLYVPKGSVELYKTAMVWKDFGIFEEIETDGISVAATGIALRSVGNGFAAIGTAAGERVEVYGFDGRLIYSGVTAEGETFIPVSEKACILRIGSKAIKFAK